MKNFKIGTLTVDAVDLGSRGSAVLGIRDSGKTYTATMIAEKLYESGIPIIAFDPIGVWRYLRVPGKGRGYPVVVAGGTDGDLPLTVASAPEIVRSAMRNGLSLVIDLFDVNLSKADWKRIVTSCVLVLLHENGAHGLRHVFIEEAAEFAPQIVNRDDAQVYSVIEKLARMGGNSRLGYTLINQRAEQVNKAVLELCDYLFLHRQKGRNSLTALGRWLDIGNVQDGKAIIDTLPTLPTGQCWAWPHGSERPVLVKVPEKNSFHPDRTVMFGGAATKAKAAVDVAEFVDSMRKTLVKVEAEKKASDPVLLKAEVAKLRAEKAAMEKKIAAAAPAVDAEAIKKAEERGFEQAVPPIRRTWSQTATLAGIKARGGSFNTGKKALLDSGIVVEHGNLVAVAAPSENATTAVADAAGLVEMWKSRLSAAAPRILNLLYESGGSMSQAEIAEMLNIQPRGGSWNTSWAELRNNEIVTVSGGVATLTDLFMPT